MTTTLTSDQAQRILEILSDVHDEQQPDNPEYAAEVDALCAALQPQTSHLYTVVYQNEDGYFFEFTARAEKHDDVLAMLEDHPHLPQVEGKPITIVVHHAEYLLPTVDAEHPAMVGEHLYYRDPDDDASSGLYRVASAPELVEEECGDEEYAGSVIRLVNDAGAELEAYPNELRRIA